MWARLLSSTNQPSFLDAKAIAEAKKEKQPSSQLLSDDALAGNDTCSEKIIKENSISSEEYKSSSKEDVSEDKSSRKVLFAGNNLSSKEKSKESAEREKVM